DGMCYGESNSISTEEPSSSPKLEIGLNCLRCSGSYIYETREIDILFRAQVVCSMWRKVSKEPLLFRYVDMRNRWDLFDSGYYDMKKMAREAVDRSCVGWLNSSMEHFGTDDLVDYI
ncbi:hypothetical protein MKW92_043781, partial [Papaver armeniacum]